MDWFKSIQRWHKMNIWTKEMVGDAVVAGKITTEQYKDITKEEYATVTQAEA